MPALPADLVASIASRVELDPVPARTLQRLFAIFTALLTTSSFSPCVKVGDSPVVPTATTPVIPATICASINFANAARSTSPFRNGVTSLSECTAKHFRASSGHRFAQMKHRFRNHSVRFQSFSSVGPQLKSKSNVNRAVENELGRAGQGHVAEFIPCSFEIHA